MPVRNKRDIAGNDRVFRATRETAQRCGDPDRRGCTRPWFAGRFARRPCRRSGVRRLPDPTGSAPAESDLRVRSCQDTSLALRCGVIFPVVERAPGDGGGLLDGIDRIVAGLVFRYRPPLVCVVRIRRWFDHRWLSFSGRGRVNMTIPWPAPEVALDEFHQDKLTFPPFAPTRVAAEHHWERTSAGNYVRAVPGFRVHRRMRQHSSANLQRRVADLVASGLFVWFSSPAEHDDRASVLVYVVNDGVTIPWFASLRAEPTGWTLGEVKGLGRPEVEELLDHPPTIHREPAAQTPWRRERWRR